MAENSMRLGVGGMNVQLQIYKIILIFYIIGIVCKASLIGIVTTTIRNANVIRLTASNTLLTTEKVLSHIFPTPVPSMKII